ncbi:MAG: tyrosyl-tRNA synthetase [Microgenomates group bacterium Gr01-1014_5]|nr:MAG: tyrosyl-tRNA synthetase [Microgenomates group bacterium Gr01-1014_5]
MQGKDLLDRRVANVLPSKDGLADLMGKKKIRLYQGFDPTGTRLHLGHSVGIRKLMDFANAGHEVIFLFGTGTVLAGGGDPSGRETGRKMITQEEIDENIKGWKDQVAPLVDWDKVSIKQNGDWLVPLSLKDILSVASHLSAVQLFKREMFQRRIENGDTVSFAETFYPMLQGYDSVVMDVDLEIGGTDQEFNMLIGRELMRKIKGKEKFVLTTPMILGTDGQQMSKTRGNAVWLDDTAEDMFGKLMALPDEHVASYIELVTDLPIDSTKDLHPMEAKKVLAFDVAKQFHGEEKAQEAKSIWESTFQKGEVPTDIPTHKLNGEENVVDILVNSGTVSSKSEARRLIEQGGIELDGTKVTDPTINLDASGTLRIGKHRFLKVQ